MSAERNSERLPCKLLIWLSYEGEWDAPCTQPKFVKVIYLGLKKKGHEVPSSLQTALITDELIMHIFINPNNLVNCSQLSLIYDNCVQLPSIVRFFSDGLSAQINKRWNSFGSHTYTIYILV